MEQFTISGFADEINPAIDLQIAGLHACGVSYMEMRGVNGKNICDYTLEETKGFKKLLDDGHIGVSAIGSPIGKTLITDDCTAEYEKLRHTIAQAKILHTDYIRMFSFYIPQNENPDDYRDEVIARWKHFADIAMGSGITLLHENEKGIYGDTALRCKTLLDAVDCPHVKAIIDPANFIQCGEKVYPYAYELLHGHLAYMHIKDALYETRKVVLAGTGDANLPALFARLRRDGYQGFLSLEPHLTNFVGFATLEKGDAGERPQCANAFAASADAVCALLKKE